MKSAHNYAAKQKGIKPASIIMTFVMFNQEIICHIQYVDHWAFHFFC